MTAQVDLAATSRGPAMLDDLFPEGARYRTSLRSYVVLLALASLIAAFGLYQDSVASIIGAMVVAPLGGAIMAFAGALVTGRTRWQSIAFLEVVPRRSHGRRHRIRRLLDHPRPDRAHALARCAHGAGLTGPRGRAGGGSGRGLRRRRPDRCDAFPGVAIAVSLVPPLATVGICLELGRLDDAGGALLLFVTNFSAIVVVACIVFVLSGPPRVARCSANVTGSGTASSRRSSPSLVIAIPLDWRAIEQLQSVIRGAAGAPIVRDWIGDRDLAGHLVVDRWRPGPDRRHGF